MLDANHKIEAHALDLIGSSHVIGLGSGRSAERFIRALAETRLGLVCVPTSEATAALARSLGLRLSPLQPIDVTFDGADEVDPDLNLLKGYGGALLREKVVAYASSRVVILVAEDKLVHRLGERGRLPVEVVPFAVPMVGRALAAYGPALRRNSEEVFVTDNGNHILDCAPPAPLLRSLDEEWRAIPGVVATGLFFELATTVLVERRNGVEQLRRH